MGSHEIQHALEFDFQGVRFSLVLLRTETAQVVIY